MCFAFLPSPASSLTSRHLSHQPTHSILRSTPTRVAHAALGPGTRGGQSGGGGGGCCLSTPHCPALHAWKRVAKGICPLAATVGKRASLLEETVRMKVCAYQMEQACCSVLGTILINNRTVWLHHQHSRCHARDWSWSQDDLMRVSVSSQALKHFYWVSSHSRTGRIWVFDGDHLRFR